MPFSLASPFSIRRFNFFCLQVLLTRASLLVLAKSLYYFSLRLFVCILYQLLLFLLWRCFEKNRSDVKWIPFFYILENFSAKEFSENSWETLGFSRKILLGNLARSREYKQYRKQKRRAEEGAEKRTRYEVTKIAPSAFFGGGGTGSGASEGRVGES